MLFTTKVAGLAPLLLAAASNVLGATTTAKATIEVNVNDTGWYYFIFCSLFLFFYQVTRFTGG